MLQKEEKLKIAKKNINKKLPVNILIIPFSYQNKVSYKNTLDELTMNRSELRWEYATIASQDSELFEHIYHLIESHIIGYKNKNECIGNQSASCIGTCLELTTNGQSIPHLGNKKEWVEIYEHKDKVGAYRLKNIKMVLFKTGIGFLILDIEYPKAITVKEVAKLNNIIKSTKNSNHTFYFNKELEIKLDKTDILNNKPDNKELYIKVEIDNQIKYIPSNKMNTDPYEKINDFLTQQLFQLQNEKHILKYKVKYTFEELIDTVLMEIIIITFFNNVYDKDDGKFYPKKAHIFSSVLVENDGWDLRDFETVFYHLRKGYKETYLPSNLELHTDNNPEILKPFFNSYWGVAREGCANLSHLTEDETTNAFFCGNYAERIDNYIYIYLLALHQYYGLLYLTKKTAELSYESSIYVNNDTEFEKITSLRDEINFFYLKCIYEEVSHISHQAKLYNKMIEEFCVRRMVDELHLEMDRIIGIIAQVREDISKQQREEADEVKKQKEIRKSKNFKIISIAGAMFTIVQTYSAALQTWDITANLDTKFRGFEFINAIITVFSTIFLGIVFWVVWRIIDREK